MSQPTSNPKEPSKLRKLLSGNTDDPIKRLPRRIGSTTPNPPASPSPEAGWQPRYKFLPAFWTFTGILSLIVNLVLIAILLVALRMLGVIQLTANDQLTGLLGGLYTNFVKMDEATIAANIPVDATIPLNIVVPVQMSTRIRLYENYTIPARVYIQSENLLIDEDATVTLFATPPGAPGLPITLDFQLTVQDSIPIHLDVPVNIPLKNTQLHEPFTGLRQVVEPWYCLVEPNALVNGVQVCSPLANPINPIVITPTVTIPPETEPLTP